MRLRSMLRNDANTVVEVRNFGNLLGTDLTVALLNVLPSNCGVIFVYLNLGCT